MAMASRPSVGLFQRDELVAEHQVHRDLLEQIVMQLEIAEIDELAAIAPRNIARALHLVGNRHRRFRQLRAIQYR